MMDGVRVPDSQRLEVRGLRGPFSCLNNARYGIAWGVLGAANECMAKAMGYVKDRKMFGHPLSSYQLVQYKLAHMLSEVAVGMEACLQVGRLKDAKMLNPTQISIIKRNSCLKALEAARECRDILGGNGIIDAYEGTHDIHSLIIGREMTGILAFDHNGPHDP